MIPRHVRLCELLLGIADVLEQGLAASIRVRCLEALPVNPFDEFNDRVLKLLMMFSDSDTVWSVAFRKIGIYM